MRKLTLLLAVMTLAINAQAGVLRMHAGNQHQVRKHQVVNPAISQSQAMELQTQQLNQPQRVITSMPEDSPQPSGILFRINIVVF